MYKAKHFDEATILFTDFKGFTEQSAKLSAQDLVLELNTCFKAFDGIMEKHRIEKIKTIGDAYMAASGINTDGINELESAKLMVLAALEMQAFIVKRKNEFDAQISSPSGRLGGAFNKVLCFHAGLFLDDSIL